MGRVLNGDPPGARSLGNRQDQGIYLRRFTLPRSCSRSLPVGESGLGREGSL
jgi:hypothetical protein